MRIKEFLITRYGLLQNKTPLELRDFNLFYGKNETGKTLALEALVKFLLSKAAKKFEGMDRVEEYPEGYVLIEDSKGKNIKLPERGDLTKIVDLTSSECCNVFVIRNSELSIAGESELYTNVTDRLTGLRTEDISEIKEEIREIGKITPTGFFSNTQEDNKLKTRIGEADRLIQEIEGKAEKMEKQGFDELTEKSQRKTEQIRALAQKLAEFEKARKREKYEKGLKALQTLKQDLKVLKDLRDYKEEDYKSWRDAKRDIENLKPRREKLKGEFREAKEGLKKKKEKLNQAREEFLTLKHRKEKIGEKIVPHIREYEDRKKQAAPWKSTERFISLFIWVSIAIFVLSLMGMILRGSLFFKGLTGLSLIAFASSGILKFQLVRRRGRIASLIEGIKLSASKLGLRTKNIGQILSGIQQIDQEHSKKERKVRDIEKETEVLNEKNKELKQTRIPELEREIKAVRKNMEEVQEKVKAKTLQEYKKKLERKQGREESKRKQESILKSHFGTKEKGLKEKIDYWNKEIGGLKQYQDQAKQVEYNEKLVSELKEKRKFLGEEKEQIKHKLYNFYQELGEVERKANEILPLEKDYLHCKTLLDLKEIGRRLKEFVQNNKIERENALEALEIFDQIGTEEEKKISGLFGRDASASNYFSEVTAGRYKQVIFDPQEKRILVERRDGKMLEVKKLSGGAYDQLYLSIRLSLGEKLLGEQQGFFIMDDPFVKADFDRLQKQLEVLKRICYDFGWQILYFTAKDEVKNALKKDIESNKVNYIEMPDIFA